jgi:hypothetical protein
MMKQEHQTNLPPVEWVPEAGLQRVAEAMAGHGDAGAVIISYGKDGIRLGMHGVSPADAEKALCTPSYYHILFEHESIASWEIV